MNVSYFTFGQSHTHSCNGKTLDKDCVVKITAQNPRSRMVELFGLKWSNEYSADSLPDIIRYYPRGIIEL